MKTGIELGTKERQEQIEKHGFDAKNDAHYQDGELLKAALFCINPDQFEWPYEWSNKFREKIKLNTDKERYSKAIAFIAAEIDRLQK